MREKEYKNEIQNLKDYVQKLKDELAGMKDINKELVGKANDDVLWVYLKLRVNLSTKIYQQ